MKNQEPVLHCFFTEEEKTLPELLEESFRLYLRWILTAQTCQQVPCGIDASC